MCGHDVPIHKIFLFSIGSTGLKEKMYINEKKYVYIAKKDMSKPIQFSFSKENLR